MSLTIFDAVSVSKVTRLDAGVCFAVVVALAVAVVSLRQRNQPPLPPGPKGWPFIGNIFDIPEKRQWHTYSKWARELNTSIIYLNMMGTTMIVVNNLETAIDLFERRGLTYSNRPRMPMMTEACGFEWNFGFCQDMEQWKVCRREFELRFRQVSSRQFREAEIDATNVLLNKLLDSPDRFMHHLRHITGSLILDIVYGINAKNEDDEWIKIAEQAQEGLDASGDTNIIDIFPWVQHIPSWLPGFRWKQKVDVWKSWSIKMRDAPYQFVRGELERGLEKPCITTDLIANFEAHCEDTNKREYLIKSTAASTYNAGSHTTVSALNSVILVMTLFPDVQRRAHAEIDSVVDSARLPDFTDEKGLPYITAVIKEVLRWTAFVPFAVPHSTSAPDIYKGYYIPKNALIVPNSWAILHDPANYPDPDRFNPDRFLTPDGTSIDPNVQDPEAAFGYGRRICPGRFMALDTIWIITACLLAMFKVERKIGPEGNHIPLPEELFSSGFVTHPNPFQCEIKPRSEKAIQLIRALCVD